MDKTTETMKDGREIKTQSRSIFITDMEEITAEVMQKSMVVKKQDVELSAKPMKRFLMANEHDPNRIERLLFKDVAQKGS